VQAALGVGILPRVAQRLVDAAVAPGDAVGAVGGADHALPRRPQQAPRAAQLVLVVGVGRAASHQLQGQASGPTT